jgi:hypothetical protein
MASKLAELHILKRGGGIEADWTGPMAQSVFTLQDIKIERFRAKDAPKLLLKEMKLRPLETALVILGEVLESVIGNKLPQECPPLQVLAAISTLVSKVAEAARNAENKEVDLPATSYALKKLKEGINEGLALWTSQLGDMADCVRRVAPTMPDIAANGAVVLPPLPDGIIYTPPLLQFNVAEYLVAVDREIGEIKARDEARAAVQQQQQQQQQRPLKVQRVDGGHRGGGSFGNGGSRQGGYQGGGGGGSNRPAATGPSTATVDTAELWAQQRNLKQGDAIPGAAQGVILGAKGAHVWPNAPGTAQANRSQCWSLWGRGNCWFGGKCPRSHGKFNAITTNHNNIQVRAGHNAFERGSVAIQPLAVTPPAHSTSATVSRPNTIAYEASASAAQKRAYDAGASDAHRMTYDVNASTAIRWAQGASASEAQQCAIDAAAYNKDMHAHDDAVLRSVNNVGTRGTSAVAHANSMNTRQPHEAVGSLQHLFATSSGGAAMDTASYSDDVDSPPVYAACSYTGARAAHTQPSAGTLHTHAMQLRTASAAVAIGNMTDDVNSMTNDNCYTCNASHITKQCEEPYRSAQGEVKEETSQHSAERLAALQSLRMAQSNVRELGELGFAEFAQICTQVVELHKGDLNSIVRGMHGGNLTSHIDPARVLQHYGRGVGYKNIKSLMNIAENGVPINVNGVFNLNNDIERGNYPMTELELGYVTKKLIEDFKWGRAFRVTKETAVKSFSDRLRVMPMFVKHEGEGKARVIHDHSAEDAQGGSVNGATDFKDSPAVQCGKVFDAVIEDLWDNMQEHPSVPTLISKIDVKSAFRQAPSNLEGVLLGYMYKGMVVIDLRLQFGWRNAPGWWGLLGDALVWSLQAEPIHEKPTPLASAVKHCAHMGIEENTESTVRYRTRPTGKSRKSRASGGLQEPPFAQIYVDDSILTAVRHQGSDAYIKSITVHAVSDHMMLLGEPRSDSDEPPPVGKETHWATVQNVLGWDIDTELGVVSMRADKLDKLRARLQEWKRGRIRARVSELRKLLGMMYNATYAIRSGKQFIKRLNGEMREQLKGKWHGGHTWINITEAMQQDLDYWRYTVSKEVRGNLLRVNMCTLVMRDPDLIMLSDASHMAEGGYCLQTGVYWCREHTEEEVTRLVQGVAGEKVRLGDGSLHINLLELYGMIMTAYVMIVVEGMRPGPGGGTILLRGDNQAAIWWILSAGGRAEPRVGVMCRILSALEVFSGWTFKANHIKGSYNTIADGISRLQREKIEPELHKLAPELQWRRTELRLNERMLSTSMLACMAGRSVSAPTLAQYFSIWKMWQLFRAAM